MHPLVEESAKKAAVAWLRVGEDPPAAVWCLWVDGALFVVSGPGEQPAPGLAAAGTAVVTLRGDHGGQIVTWPAEVATVQPDGEEWTRIAPQLAAKRLNATGGAAQLVTRWAAECTISRLRPSGEPVVAGTGSLAAPPRPTPATRRTARPFTLRLRRRR